MCYFVSESLLHIFYLLLGLGSVVSGRVRVKVRFLRVMLRVSACVRLRCHLANKVSVSACTSPVNSEITILDHPANNISLKTYR